MRAAIDTRIDQKSCGLILFKSRCSVVSRIPSTEEIVSGIDALIAALVYASELNNTV